MTMDKGLQRLRNMIMNDQLPQNRMEALWFLMGQFEDEVKKSKGKRPCVEATDDVLESLRVSLRQAHRAIHEEQGLDCVLAVEALAELISNGRVPATPIVREWLAIRSQIRDIEAES